MGGLGEGGTLAGGEVGTPAGEWAGRRMVGREGEEGNWGEGEGVEGGTWEGGEEEER